MRPVVATLVACVVLSSLSFTVAAQAPVQQTPTSSPPTAPSPLVSPTVEQTPVDQAPTDQAPVEQPPLQEPPPQQAPAPQTVVVAPPPPPAPQAAPQRQGSRIPEQPPGRTWVLSVSGVVGSGTLSVEEEDAEVGPAFEDATFTRGPFFFGTVSGFAGLVVAKSAWGHIEHGLGYLLNAGMGEHDFLHSHNIAYQLDTPWLGFDIGLGVGVHHPFDEDEGETDAGFNVSVRFYGYVAGPVFVGLYSDACAFNENSSFATGGAMLGISNR